MMFYPLFYLRTHSMSFSWTIRPWPSLSVSRF